MKRNLSNYAKIIENACGVDVTVLRMNEKTLSGNCFCHACTMQCDFLNTHTYGTYEAARWGGKYIYFCQIGLTFIASSIFDTYGSVSDGLIAGPFIMGALDNYTDDTTILHLSNTVRTIDTKRANGIADLLGLLTSGDVQNSKSKLLNELYEVSKDISKNAEYQYPIETERQLQAAITEGNKTKANEILNKLLGHIFFSSGGNIEMIKGRVLELIVLLSRASIDGGAEIGQILGLNDTYMKELQAFQTLEDISLWLTHVMSRFTSYVFDFADVKHADIIYKTIRYIKDNYMKKLSLDEIADNVYLSKAYLSKVFKDETGMNITEYINKIRIDESKKLLKNTNLSIIAISNMTGFYDQSYFTKIFTKTIGTTPRKYKEANGKIKK